MQALYARHSVRVYRFLLRLVRDPTVAEDLVSDVCFDVWQQAGRFEARSSGATWILSIARYKALATYRARRNAALEPEWAEAIRGRGRHAGGHGAEAEQGGGAAPMSRRPIARAPRGDRSYLLPRE